MQHLLLSSLVLGLVHHATAVDTSTLDGKFVVGYQGWFRKPGQDDGNSHWARNGPSPTVGDVGVDFVPDVDGYPADCLFDTPFTLPNGKNAQFFTSDCAGVTDYHFQLMQNNGIDGAFVQRFYGYLTNKAGQYDRVLQNIKTSAEKHGLGFVIEYDLTGASSSDDIANTILNDLRDQSSVLQSSAYFHHNGKPVVEIWGLGIRTEISVNDAQNIVNAVKNAGYYVILGVQQAWRSELSQASPPSYGSVYRLADTIQPWTIGSFDHGSYPGFYSGTQVPDSQELKNLNIASSIVAWPGASSANSAQGGNYDGYPRYNGSFYQDQLNNAVSLKPQFIFGAMFDEVNEGTAIFPVLRTNELPTNQRFVGIDNDMDHDFYLKQAGAASAALKKNR